MSTVTYLSCLATVSECGKYRFDLTRVWCGTGPTALWIMLNPSTADGTVDDPTIRKCVGFSKRWGCSGMVVCNLYPCRATNPKDIRAGGESANVSAVRDALARCGGPVVFGWGASGPYETADKGAGLVRVLEPFHQVPMCLGKTKDGSPRHPLYVPYDTPLQEY